MSHVLMKNKKPSAPSVDMSFKSKLRLGFCGYKAAKYACTYWHYTGKIPAGKRVHIGVWEDGRFVGVVIFSRGASAALGKPYNLDHTEICELTRIALRDHKNPVSRILAIAIKMLRKINPGIRLIISFADPDQNHHGGIYQATNWVYSGKTAAEPVYIDKNGREWHNRELTASGKVRIFNRIVTRPRVADCIKVKKPGKHRYLYPLDETIREIVIEMAKPYPKRHAPEALQDAPFAQNGMKATSC